MRWYPVRTSTEYPRPEPGQLIALRHAVWRVEKVQDLPLSDTDRDKWLDAGMPNIATWRRRPYRVRAQWVAGAKPEWLTAAQTSAQMDIPADTYMTWHVYEGAGGRSAPAVASRCHAGPNWRTSRSPPA